MSEVKKKRRDKVCLTKLLMHEWITSSINSWQKVMKGTMTIKTPKRGK